MLFGYLIDKGQLISIEFQLTYNLFYYDYVYFTRVLFVQYYLSKILEIRYFLGHHS